MNTGFKILTLLAAIRDDADAMLQMFDAGGDLAHAFWLHVDDDVLSEISESLDEMYTNMRKEPIAD